MSIAPNRTMRCLAGVVLAVVASGCATRVQPAPAEHVATAQADACARPMVLVQNLTHEAVSLYEVRGRRQVFIAEVAAGGAYQHRAAEGAFYRLRAGRGRDTRILNHTSFAGATGQAGIEQTCAG